MNAQLHLSLSPDLEARLRAQAEACGEPLERHAERLLSDALLTPSIDEVLAPYRRQVANSGLSDDDLDAFYEGLRDQAWRDRPPQKSA